jgi:hypothetical protein
VRASINRHLPDSLNIELLQSGSNSVGNLVQLLLLFDDFQQMNGGQGLRKVAFPLLSKLGLPEIDAFEFELCFGNFPHDAVQDRFFSALYTFSKAQNGIELEAECHN